jgi:hypothetical protein
VNNEAYEGTAAFDLAGGVSSKTAVVERQNDLFGGARLNVAVLERENVSTSISDQMSPTVELQLKEEIIRLAAQLQDATVLNVWKKNFFFKKCLEKKFFFF